MIYKCPNCSKEIELSDDELQSQGNLIVCPCCLSEFPGDPTKPGATGNATPHYVYSTPGVAQPDTVSYCRFCGAQLNGTCNFCPVCGNRLIAPATATTHTTVPTSQGTFSHAPKQPAAAPKPPQVPYMPSYRHADFGQNNNPPKRPKAPVLAYLLIVLLVLLFIYLIR